MNEVETEANVIVNGQQSCFLQLFFSWYMAKTTFPSFPSCSGCQIIALVIRRWTDLSSVCCFQVYIFLLFFPSPFYMSNWNEDHSFQKLTLEDCKDGVVNTAPSNSELFIGGELFNGRKYMLWSLCERELKLFGCVLNHL